jgi:hypothetical protein
MVLLHDPPWSLVSVKTAVMVLSGDEGSGG